MVSSKLGQTSLHQDRESAKSNCLLMVKSGLTACGTRYETKQRSINCKDPAAILYLEKPCSIIMIAISALIL